MNLESRRGYALLVAGHILSTFGTSIYLIGLVLYLAEATSSATVLGSVQFAAYLPAALLGPIAGVLVDRWNRRLILIGSDLVRGAAMIAVPATGLLIGRIPISAVIVCSVVVGAAGVFFVPAVHSMVPDLVAPAHIKRANGFRTAATQVANLAGSALGASIYILVGAPVLFLLNGVSFVVSAIAEIPIRPRSAPRDSGPVRTAVKEGLRFITASRGIRAVVGVQAATNLLLPAVVVALPFVISDVWGLPQVYFGLAFATVLAGGILAFVILSGVRISAQMESRWYRASLPAVCIFLTGLSVLSLPPISGWPGVRWVLFPLFLIAGAGVGSVYLIGVTRIQQVVAPQRRGRVFAAGEALTALFVPFSYLLSGLVVDQLRGAEWIVFAALAAAALCLSILVQANPSLTTLLRHPAVGDPGHNRPGAPTGSETQATSGG